MKKLLEKLIDLIPIKWIDSIIDTIESITGESSDPHRQDVTEEDFYKMSKEDPLRTLKFSYDAYIWKGAELTRSFREWRLIRKLIELNLPVPIPAAAYYIKKGLFYRANILTQEIPAVESLAAMVINGNTFENFWRKVGEHISRFHNIGLYHADLNAYNIQIDKDAKMWLIDFDQSQILSPGKWRFDNLNRLKRSLNKILIENIGAKFKSSDWLELKEGYSQALRSL